MPFVEFYNVGTVGIVKDIPAHELPPEAWSDGRNVRFVDSKVRQMEGYRGYDDSICASPTFAIAAPRQDSTADVWVYCSETDVYAFDGSANAKISVSSISGTGQNVWTGALLSGVLTINNPGSTPKYWAFPPVLTTKLAALPDWSASWSCAVIRSFKNYLVALNMTEKGTSYPYRVRWSHAAEPGTVPASWDAADTTLDAGYNDILQGGDFVVDAAPLVDRLMVYKENSTWAMSYIGGTYVFKFEQVYSNWGALSRHSVAALGRMHFVVGQSEIYVHDGFSDPQPLLQGRLKDYFYKTIQRSQTDKVCCVVNYPQKEVWVLFPTESDGTINKALIWNYEGNHWAIRDLPAVKGGNHGAIEYRLSSTTWNAKGGTWDESFEIWNEEAAYRENRIILYGSELFVFDSGFTADGANYTSYVERKALPINQQDRGGSPKPEHQTMKFIRGVWPRMKVRRSGSVRIYVGTQEDPMDTVVWSGPYLFNPMTMKKIDCRVTGRFIAIRFEAPDDIGWHLDSFGLDLDIVGRW